LPELDGNKKSAILVLTYEVWHTTTYIGVVGHIMTERQFKYIEDQYKDEISRDEALSKKAQVYLSINSIIITALIFKATDLQTLLLQPSCADIILTFSVFVFIFISFLCVLLTLAIYEYERPTDMDTIIEEQDKSITDNDFFENRASDYIVAFEENAKVCDRKASFLRVSLISMIIAFTSSLLLILINIL